MRGFDWTNSVVLLFVSRVLLDPDGDRIEEVFGAE
jgi:hypothetical protein